MSNATNDWLAGILMSPRPMPTAFDVPLGTSQSQVAEPIPYLLPHQEQPRYVRRIADALARGQSQQDFSQSVDEALAAQQARDAFAMRTRQSVQPEGGRKEGDLTEFMIPKSPLDYASLALGGPLRAGVKAGLLGMGLVMESSPAQASVGKLAQAGSGLLGRVVGRFPQYAERYPAPGPAIRKVDPDTGKEYLAKLLTPEAEEFRRYRALVDSDMKRNGFVPHFDPSKRFHVDPSYYRPEFSTLDIIPKNQATIDRYNRIIGSDEVREQLQQAFVRGLAIPNARDVTALGQLERELIENLGLVAGRRAFRDLATSIAVTSAGANAQSNLLMALYGNFARHNLPLVHAAHELPFPAGSRFAMPNLRRLHAIHDAGRWDAFRAPKTHNYAQNLMGNRNVSTIDDKITAVMLPGHTAPPRGTYGLLERVLGDEASRVGWLPADYTDLVRAGIMSAKGAKHSPLQPVISDFNDVIERIHRITGRPRDDISSALGKGTIPAFGVGGMAVLPALRSPTGMQEHPAPGQ